MKIEFGDCWSPANAMVREIMELLFPNYEKCGDYKFGTIEGLYKMDTEEAIEIVAINNNCPHNGDFAKFLEALETLSKTEKKPVRIVCFMNDRLFNHVKRRKGWHTPIFANDALEYIG